jgi:hypothetical protein
VLGSTEGLELFLFWFVFTRRIVGPYVMDDRQDILGIGVFLASKSGPRLDSRQDARQYTIESSTLPADVRRPTGVSEILH